jgi:hypothetical protein
MTHCQKLFENICLFHLLSLLSVCTKLVVVLRNTSMIVKYISCSVRAVMALVHRWECHVCGEVCRNWNSLSVHCRRMHEEAAHVVCLCAKVLASRASIIKHRLKHTNTYKYRCRKLYTYIS